MLLTGAYNDMILTYRLPEQQEELDVVLTNIIIPHHIWHDVPNHMVYIYTGEDYDNLIGETV